MAVNSITVTRLYIKKSCKAILDMAHGTVLALELVPKAVLLPALMATLQGTTLIIQEHRKNYSREPDPDSPASFMCLYTSSLPAEE